VHCTWGKDEEPVRNFARETLEGEETTRVDCQRNRMEICRMDSCGSG